MKRFDKSGGLEMYQSNFGVKHSVNYLGIEASNTIDRYLSMYRDKIMIKLLNMQDLIYFAFTHSSVRDIRAIV